MRDDDFDDDDDLEPPERPRFPGIVMAAGVIWIAVGVLAMVNGMLSIVLAGANAAGGGGGGGNAGSPCCGILIAIAFVSCGYNTVTGKAKDTLGNSIGSLLLGLIYLAVGIGFALVAAGAFGNMNALPIAPEAIIAVAILTGMIGITLEMAGIFGLVGRRAYREWRKVAHPKKRRRPRNDDEEDA